MICLIIYSMSKLNRSDYKNFFPMGVTMQQVHYELKNILIVLRNKVSQIFVISMSVLVKSHHLTFSLRKNTQIYSEFILWSLVKSFQVVYIFECFIFPSLIFFVQCSSIQYVRKIFRKTNISYSLTFLSHAGVRIRGQEMLDPLKILRTY